MYSVIADSKSNTFSCDFWIKYSYESNGSIVYNETLLYWTKGKVDTRKQRMAKISLIRLSMDDLYQQLLARILIRQNEGLSQISQNPS